jgi:hypothetical protein
LEIFGTWIKQSIVDEETYKTIYQTLGVSTEPAVTAEQVMTAVNDLRAKMSNIVVALP